MDGFSPQKEEYMSVHGVLLHIKGEWEKMEEKNIWNHPQGEINRNLMSSKDVLALLCFKILNRAWPMRGFGHLKGMAMEFWWILSVAVSSLSTWSETIYLPFSTTMAFGTNGPSCYHEGKSNGPNASAEVRRPNGLGFHAAHESSSVAFLSTRTSLIINLCFFFGRWVAKTLSLVINVVLFTPFIYPSDLYKIFWY